MHVLKDILAFVKRLKAEPWREELRRQRADLQQQGKLVLDVVALIFLFFVLACLAFPYASYITPHGKWGTS